MDVNVLEIIQCNDQEKLAVMADDLYKLKEDEQYVLCLQKLILTKLASLVNVQVNRYNRLFLESARKTINGPTLQNIERYVESELRKPF